MLDFRPHKLALTSSYGAMPAALAAVLALIAATQIMAEARESLKVILEP